MNFVRLILFFMLTQTQVFATPQLVGEIDISSWSNNVAVFSEGRVKSYETFARSYMQRITGPRLINNQSSAITFLDMMIRPDQYENKPIIFVKNKNIRAVIADEIKKLFSDKEADLAVFMQSGLISKENIQLPTVRNKLQNIRGDVMRFATPVEQIDIAMGASDPRNMWANLQVLPPNTGAFSAPWSTLDKVQNQDIVDSWSAMVEAWQASNFEQVNINLVELSVLLPDLANNTEIYPSSRKLQLESLYFRLGNLTSIWIIFLIAIVLLLMAFVYRFEKVGSFGLWLFAIAVTLNTVAVIWRWYVSGRYPNTNMFEAITTAAWMGCLFCGLMEYAVRRKNMRYLFALGGSTAAVVALLATRLYPLELNPHISNRMPVLHDVWLYIHVNFIIFSYCLIFVASITALIYLVRRLVQKLQNKNSSFDFAKSGGLASLIKTNTNKTITQKTNMGEVLDGATMILVEISFIMLWSGIVMGAIWADHSWGRPWGWDPKEVFALNTFLVFAVLIHTRLKVKDKGFWTAVLALVGCSVMLFNWIIINFTISGLHSYA